MDGIVDKIDLNIINLLQADGRKPYTDIAKILGISEGTVRNRVSRLLQEQVIQIVSLVDPSKMGYDAPALIGVSVQPSMLDAVAKKISGFPEVNHLVMVSGEFDLFVSVLCRDRNHLATFLNEKLMHVSGISRTQTFLTLKTYKMTPGPGQGMVKAVEEKKGSSDKR